MRLTRKETQRQTRDKLLAAAHSSIVEEGVAAMSIRNICSAAGHSQGAFYSNFASKDDLLVEILQAHIQDEVVLLRDLVAHCSGDDIEATLQVLAARLAKLADEQHWSLLSIELQLHARRDPAFAERHREGKAACHHLFGELVADLTRRFALRPALPPLQLAARPGGAAARQAHLLGQLHVGDHEHEDHQRQHRAQDRARLADLACAQTPQRER